MITIYSPEGTPHRCHPVDARELIDTQGYTTTPGVSVEDPRAAVRNATETAAVYEFPDLDDPDQIKATLTKLGIRFHPNNKIETLVEKVVEYERTHGHVRPNAPVLPAAGDGDNQ